MTPTIHSAGPHARVITLPNDQDRFTVPPGPSGTDSTVVTTLTVERTAPPRSDEDGITVTLQGTVAAGPDAGEFVDLAAFYAPGSGIGARLVYAYAPITTQQALERAVTELRHPAGKSPTPTAPGNPHAERDALLQGAPGGIVTSLDVYRRSHGR